jgi:ectoine hydroxylase-related dioxygenase (phytanoyl-CoA dioxygenase family)
MVIGDYEALAVAADNRPCCTDRPEFAMAIDIDSPYALAPAAVEFFRENGFIKLKNVLSAEALAHYGAEITRLTIELSTESMPLQERTTYGKAFLQVMNLWESSRLVEEFVLGRRLGRIAAELLAVSGVRLYHDQSLYKEPGGGLTPAHADQYYWPLASDRTVTAWIPLQVVPREMGPLAFYAGSQTVELGRDLAISDESESLITAHMQAHGLPIVDEPFDLGEVSFHTGWTFHRAGPNASGRPRSVMTIIYMDENMKLVESMSANQRKDWSRFCPGSLPGMVIATLKNPVIFSR